MVELPNEVWGYIASFIPKKNWNNNVLAINPVFLDLALNMRYSDVKVDTQDVLGCVKMLGRLSDPFVAKRVKTLFIRLSHTREEKSPSRAPSSTSLNATSPAVRDAGLVRTHLQDTLHYIFSRTTPARGSSGKSQPSAATFLMTISIGDIMENLIAVMPRMNSVKMFTLDCWDVAPAFDLRPLCEALWGSRPSSTITLNPRFSGLHKPIPMTFGDRLTTLSLSGNLESYKVIIKSRPRLASIQELHLQITNGLQVDLDTDAEILVRDVAPFVIGLGKTLKVLSVTSWASIDLSGLFMLLAGRQMGQRNAGITSAPTNLFPVLSSLNVKAPFNRAFCEPAGLKDLIVATSDSLTHLNLRLNPNGVAFDSSCEHSLAHWLVGDFLDSSGSAEKGLGADGSLSKLSILDIYPTNLPQGMDFLLNIIEKCSATLVDVTIRERHLQPAEAKALIEALGYCSKLTTLRINMWHLDLDLLDLLALHLPDLKSLWLSAGDIWRSNPEELETFLQALSSRKYTNWKVDDLHLWKVSQKVDIETMMAFARSIPSVTSFYGNGRMVL